MFTGIVQATGKLSRKERHSMINKLVIRITNQEFLSDVDLGDSILVNGICLTVIKSNPSDFVVEYMPETEKVTAIKSWQPGKKLNLEKALRPGRGLDGHIVQGHVDGTGKIVKFLNKGNFRELVIFASSDLTRYIVPKGSVAIDGISLTVITVSETEFSTGIIKHTFDNTNLSSLNRNDIVNIETDILGKYVEKLIRKEG